MYTHAYTNMHPSIIHPSVRPSFRASIDPCLHACMHQKHKQTMHLCSHASACLSMSQYYAEGTISRPGNCLRPFFKAFDTPCCRSHRELNVRGIATSVQQSMVLMAKVGPRPGTTFANGAGQGLTTRQCTAVRSGSPVKASREARTASADVHLLQARQCAGDTEHPSTGNKRPPASSADFGSLARLAIPA